MPAAAKHEDEHDHTDDQQEAGQRHGAAAANGGGDHSGIVPDPALRCVDQAASFSGGSQARSCSRSLIFAR
jgi:hypothetical protein